MTMMNSRKEKKMGQTNKLIVIRDALVSASCPIALARARRAGRARRAHQCLGHDVILMLRR